MELVPNFFLTVMLMWMKLFRKKGAVVPKNFFDTDERVPLVILCIELNLLNPKWLLNSQNANNIWDKVFKNGRTSKICGRQSLKKFTWSILQYFVP